MTDKVMETGIFDVLISWSMNNVARPLGTGPTLIVDEAKLWPVLHG